MGGQVLPVSPLIQKYREHVIVVELDAGADFTTAFARVSASSERGIEILIKRT